MMEPQSRGVRALKHTAPAVLASLLLTTVTTATLAPAARADAPVSVGTDGAQERAAGSGDALRNGSAASFGSPTNDDRRMFKLRWRIPFVAVGSESLEPSSF